MPQKWMIRFSVLGDLRFLSHHDCLRAIERLCERCKLPLRYSQGYNPHPIFSICLPKPVGISTRCDAVTVSLEEPVSAHHLLDKMNSHAPVGLKFTFAETFKGKAPRPIRASYEIQVDPTQVAPRLDATMSADKWVIERKISIDHGRSFGNRSIDLRPLVDEVRLEGQMLMFRLVRRGDSWARPGELLALLGLDDRLDLARLVRTEIEFESDNKTETSQQKSGSSETVPVVSQNNGLSSPPEQGLQAGQPTREDN